VLIVNELDSSSRLLVFPLATLRSDSFSRQ
jgi:hypothetical protein